MEAPKSTSTPEKTPASAGCAPWEHAPHPPRRAPASAAALERAARIFRAAGDLPRLRLLEELRDGERCVTELAAAVRAGLSTVSQQLRILRSEQLVRTRRNGKHVYYSLADRHVEDLVATVLAHAAEQE